MVRLSDLIGNKGKPPEEKSRPAAAPQPQPPPGSSISGAPAAPAAPPARPAAAASPIPPAVSGLEAYYVKLSLCVKDLLGQARSGQPLQLTEAAMLTQQVPKLSPGQYDEILMCDERHPEEHYLVTHSVHVSFLVNRLACILGYTSATGHQLSLAGLLIDIGMTGAIEQVVQAPRPLTKEERKFVAQHPSNAVALLKESQELSQEALGAIAAHHLRAGGAEVPKDLPSATVLEYARILAVADVYDALTHVRSHRKLINPAQAVKMLIDGVGDQFERRVVKALVDELSLYPRGSTVKLNTNELAVVHRVHPGSPLRPIVLIHQDADRNPVVPPRTMNLVEHPLVYIKDVVIDEPQ